MNNTNSSFNIICLRQTWCKNPEINKNSCFNTNSYNAVSFERKTSLMYKIRRDVSFSDKGKEILTTEIIIKESKGTLLSFGYRPPESIRKNF